MFVLFPRLSIKAYLLKLQLAPVQPHIEYELRQEYASEHTSSNFSGEPSPQQDRAWDDLVRRESRKLDYISNYGLLLQMLTNCGYHSLILQGDARGTGEGRLVFRRHSRVDRWRIHSHSRGISRIALRGEHFVTDIFFPCLILIFLQRQLRFYLGKDRYYPNLTQAQEEYLQYHLGNSIFSSSFSSLDND